MRVLHEMDRIKKKAEVSEDVDRETLTAMRSLIPSVSNGISSASIMVGSAIVCLDQGFSRNLNSLVEGEEYSYGSVEGRLEILNIHGPKYYCCIFPLVGAERVRCTFPLPIKKEIISAVGKSVRVYGRKHFRGTSMFPYLFDIEEVEILDLTKVVKLSSLENAMRGAIISTSIQDLRNDW